MVTRGALGAFAVNLGGVGLAFGLHLLLSRRLGLENYGVYVFAFSGVSLLAMVCKPGLRAAPWLACLVLPPLALVRSRQAGLLGFRRAAYSETPDRILRPLVMIALVLVLTAGLGWRTEAARAAKGAPPGSSPSSLWRLSWMPNRGPRPGRSSIASGTGCALAMELVRHRLADDAVVIMNDTENNLFFRDHVESRALSCNVFEFRGKYLGLIGLEA